MLTPPGSQMTIDKMLTEYAKLHLQLIQAQEQAATFQRQVLALQAQLKKLTPAKPGEKAPGSNPTLKPVIVKPEVAAVAVDTPEPEPTPEAGTEVPPPTVDAV